MSNIYYNTKTSATVEMTDQNFSNLNPDIKKNYRVANKAEIALHEKRKGQKEFIDSKRQQRAEGPGGTSSKASSTKGAASSTTSEKASDTKKDKN